MSVWDAIWLGVIQGLTEFLPVSSSGHLVLAANYFSFSNDVAFDVLVHLGTLVAVLTVLRHEVWQYAQALVQPKRNREKHKIAWTLVVATIPAAVVGFLLRDQLEIIRQPFVVVGALVLGSGLLLLVEQQRCYQEANKDQVVTKQGILLAGLLQVLALVPGTSRSGATIAGAMLGGVTLPAAVKISFLLSIPIIAGATVVELPAIISDLNMVSMTGFIVAFITGVVAIKIMLGMVTRIGLLPFVYYRLLLALVIFILLST